MKKDETDCGFERTFVVSELNSKTNKLDEIYKWSIKPAKWFHEKLNVDRLFFLKSLGMYLLAASSRERNRDIKEKP